MSTNVNTAVLHRLTDNVLTGHDLAALDEVYHADYVEDEPPPGMGPGREGRRIIMDALRMMQQLGAIPAPG